MSHRLLIAIVVVVIVPLLIFGYAKSRLTSVVLGTISETSNVEQATNNRTEVELLVLRSTGFHPAELNRPRGPFLLSLQNYSGDDELALVLKHEAGAFTGQIRFQKKQSKLREVIDLAPGRYVLTEAHHPDWICTITITSN